MTLLFLISILFEDKKILLRERKRHTARAGKPSWSCPGRRGGGRATLSWPGGGRRDTSALAGVGKKAVSQSWSRGGRGTRVLSRGLGGTLFWLGGRGGKRGNPCPSGKREGREREEYSVLLRTLAVKMSWSLKRYAMWMTCTVTLI